jgi:predicted molibdopterin-dependent oxidoreductase YjgC
VAGLATTFGSGAMTNSINEIENAELILTAGSNTTEAHPQIARRILQAVDRGAKLIVIDPRRTAIASRAHIHLALRPGTDIPLLNGMMRAIIDGGLADDVFIDMRTENFHALRDMLYRLDLKEVEAITGVEQRLWQRAAQLYAKARKAVICYCVGVTHHTCGTSNVQAYANLAMLTGKLEKENTGVDPLRGQNNVQGACDMGALPNVLPGYQEVSDPAARRKFEQAWSVFLPAEPGCTLLDMTHGGPEGPIRGLFVVGENPMLSDPDLGRVEETLRYLDLLVVSDIFLSETAAMADVVFPAASFAEKTGTFTNSERRVQMVRQAIAPLADCRSDGDIIMALASRLGYPFDYESSAEVMEEISLLNPLYGGIFHDRLEKSWGLQWPCPDRSHPGTPYLHKYAFTRGRGRFMPGSHQPPAETPDEKYPFVLMTGRVYHQYHTGTMSRKCAALNRECSEAVLEINPLDADKLAIRSGEMVRLASRLNSITLRAEVTSRVEPGQLYTTFHFAEAPINRLLGCYRDPVSNCPEYKVCAVRLEKAN